MAAEGDHMRRYNYTGGRVPHDATHVTIDQSVTVIRQRAFCGHPNIVEVICHEDVERIANMAFAHCSSLRRVIMPGVEVVEGSVFFYCRVLTDVECGKLEIIKECAFYGCESLRSITLPSVKVVKHLAFSNTALKDVTFGSKLERIVGAAFMDCPNLEQITIPLKDGIIDNGIFRECEELERVEIWLREQYMKLSSLYC
eukprot:scaffold41276_cov222-Skeletonema_dohrnii-CCMP3373.AAC.2